MTSTSTSKIDNILAMINTEENEEKDIPQENEEKDIPQENEEKDIPQENEEKDISWSLSENDYEEFIRKSRNRKRYPCEICGRTFQDEDSLRSFRNKLIADRKEIKKRQAGGPKRKRDLKEHYGTSKKQAIIKKREPQEIKFSIKDLQQLRDILLMNDYKTTQEIPEEIPQEKDIYYNFPKLNPKLLSRC